MSCAHGVENRRDVTLDNEAFVVTMSTINLHNFQILVWTVHTYSDVLCMFMHAR